MNKKKRSFKKTKVRVYLNRFVIMSSAALIVFLIVSSISYIFLLIKIEKIEVEGSNKYNQKEIIKKSEINIGENLLFCNEEKAKRNIEKFLPYIENVEIKKILPNKLVILTSEAEPNFVVRDNDFSFMIISSSWKILETTNVKDSNLAVVEGLDVKQKEPGFKLECRDAENEKFLAELLKSLKDNDLSVNKIIFLKDSKKITLDYQNKIEIILGQNHQVNYKIKTAKKLLKDNIKENESGQLDLTSLPKDGKTYFKKNS
ncbi:MAG: FtsQ-type POTRA domain-containing protein [Oscillospiraceae bacterium]|jgi:cell division protein FtsQ|nr:FtsQ-type POTRA domain-containing protein [Oscillospiraceae bacterium]